MNYSGDDDELAMQQRARPIGGLFEQPPVPALQSDVEPPHSGTDSIKRAWWRWHKMNPHVYELFKRFTLDVIRRGHRNYSSKAIFERIRWHTEIETTGEEFKMSNNYTPYYARLFMHDFPEHKEFFRTKVLRSEMSD